MTQRTVLITGASSGMGAAAARLFAARGWRVYGGARRETLIPTAPNITALHLDVTVHSDNVRFVSQVMTDQPRIDVLINNAGYGEFGPLEEVPLSAVHQQLATNLLGAADLTQLVIPIMRRQRSGRIVNISSIAGDIYTPLGGWYYVSKHALNVWSDTLDVELRQFGLRSVVVAPGDTASSWSAIALRHAAANLTTDSPYRGLLTAMQGVLTTGERVSGATSADLATVFYRAATAPHPRRRYYHSPLDQFLTHIVRAHPTLYHQAMVAGTRFIMRHPH